MKRAILIILALAIVLYGGDYLSLRLSLPRRAAVGTITVHIFYIVKLKNGKNEYDYGGDQLESCANSLFPQIGLTPCWYVARHTDQQIIIDSGTPNNPSLF